MIKKLFAVATLALAVSGIAFGQDNNPKVYNASINYNTNTITVNGKGFEPGSTPPSVKFNDVVLSPSSVSDSLILLHTHTLALTCPVSE